MIITESTKLHTLLLEHPFLEDFLVAYHPKFEMLRNRMARATIGRVATLRAAAGIAGIDVAELLQAIAKELERHTGQNVQTELNREALDREGRQRELAEIIRFLHDGGDLESARQRFAAAVEDVEASEIAAMEEELIRGGLPVSEVQRLCDVHVGAFREALDQHETLDLPPGHPVHTYMAANRSLELLCDQLGALARSFGERTPSDEEWSRAERLGQAFGGLDNHYVRKENQLFSLLERADISGPPKVMWGVHDQIRASLKSVREAIAQRDVEAFCSHAPAFARDVIEMVYKEEKVLFPLCLQTFDDADWAEIRRGEDELGYVLAMPAAHWPAAGTATASAPSPRATKPGLLDVKTGAISLEQLNLILTNLPVDLSFVDENDEVRFYSEGPQRIFPRSPAVIGRKVQNCHPPDSVSTVQEILDSFRAGTQSVAEFWLQLKGLFVHIRYFALRDEAGQYRGCLELSQEVSGIRALQGEQRLLQWNKD
ncbi:MAG: DUF438 domain-containing protein [Myxococcota bacterium]|jgi:DUF438 domain-containing protein|nr:DUF438 domain-containing protein [Myxococcota bacterium]